LQGSIKDFSVADILQLLSQQQKTGVLIVQNDKKTAEVYFSNGEVVEVKTPNDDDILGAMLVKSKTVTEDQLKQAREIQKNSIEHVCSILLRQGPLNREHYEHIITTYSYEVFYEILQWRSGTYQFVVEKTASHSSVVLPGLESILLDVLRMIDEWPEIKKMIRSFDMIFDNNYSVLEDLDADEERICALVDGRRSVQDIIDAGLLGSFYTCKALVQLLERGAIRLLSARADTGAGRKNILPQAASVAAACAGLAAVVALVVLLPGSVLESTLPAAALFQQRGSAVHQSVVQDDILKIERALDIYFFKTGKYPDRASDLAEAAILTPDDLSFLADNAIVYEKARGSYEIKARP
jgi:hypothetical protein